MQLTLKKIPRLKQWATLLFFSIALSSLLKLIDFPAALMLGPMIIGIVMGCRRSGLTIRPPLFKGAQTIVGCMIAASISPKILDLFLQNWWIFLIVILSIIFCATCLGWLLSYLKILPLSTAILGFTPGAAATMVVLSKEFGDDFRMVAFMQYLRVLMTAFTAAIIAATLIPEQPMASGFTNTALFPSLDPIMFGSTILLALVSAGLTYFLRIPAGYILVPLFLGGFLRGAGWIELQIPNWLLVISYAFIGWTIGLSFDREGLKKAYKLLPHLFITTVILMLFCALLSGVLVLIFDVDPLTAYLATSPGGLDTIAIIIFSRPHVDMSIVMTLQASRLLLINMICPFVAKLVSKNITKTA